MTTATISELKKELHHLAAPELTELLLRTARFKKENKELLTYLLFESSDEAAFIRGVQSEMAEFFADINTSNVYFAKKTIRKVLRHINKYSHYSGKPETQAELLIWFCHQLLELRLPMGKNTVLYNIFFNQLKKANNVVASLHEDLQYDFLKDLKKLEKEI